MATVYLAIQESFEREVALKVMSPQLSKDPSFGERFIREARIVSRLMHPNIVTVYDVGVHEGNHYLSMEYVPGEDLKAQRYQLTLHRALAVVKDVAKALDYAGRKGYIHRDVKPENIMIHGEDGRAVLMDFGIARASDVASGMTQTGTTMGTPHYMSPEQAKGAQVDPRSDIYGLGVVLFQLLCGYVPYDADSAVAVGIMHVSDPVPTLPEHLAVFQPIIDKVLAKKLADRYQTGGELVAALDAIAPAEIEAIEKHLASMPKIDDTDESAATVVSAPVVKTRVDTEEVARATREAEETDPGDNEGFSVRSEDSIGYKADDQNDRAPGAKRWLVSITVALIIGAGGWYAWQWRGPDSQSVARIEPRSAQPVANVRTSSSSLSVASVSSAASVAGQTAESATSARASSEPSELGALQRAFADDAQQAPALAAAYRAMDSDAREQGLADMANSLQARMQAALVEGDLARARSLAQLSAQTVPDSDRDRANREAIEEREAQLWLSNTLSEANEYLRRDALTTPAGANARERFEAVLARHPDNAEALAGIEAIAQRYGELAREALAQGDFERAGTRLERGLELDPTSESLTKLAAELDKKQAEHERRQREIERLSQQAQTRLADDRLIAPKGENAYESFQALAELAPERGQRGLLEVEQALVSRIESMMRGGALEEASLQLASARDHFTQSEDLFSLRLLLDQQIESQQPSVSRLVVSPTPLETLEGDWPQDFPAERVIYLGFEYARFGDGTSVVQALLTDGSRSVQIAQVPVIVSGPEGTKFFRIEQPVEGFGKGGYHVDLRLGDERLATTAFKVVE